MTPEEWMKFIFQVMQSIPFRGLCKAIEQSIRMSQKWYPSRHIWTGVNTPKRKPTIINSPTCRAHSGQCNNPISAKTPILMKEGCQSLFICACVLYSHRCFLFIHIIISINKNKDCYWFPSNIYLFSKCGQVSQMSETTLHKSNIQGWYFKMCASARARLWVSACACTFECVRAHVWCVTVSVCEFVCVNELVCVNVCVGHSGFDTPVSPTGACMSEEVKMTFVAFPECWALQLIWSLDDITTH